MRMMFKLLVTALVLSMSGCLTYSTWDHPEPKVYAEIAAVEVASSAALAFIPLDDAENHPKYGERFTVWLGGALLIDAFTFLVVSKPSK
jgi:hypothetical protein